MSTNANLARTITVEVHEGDETGRLDRFLANKLGDISRARLQALIRNGQVTCDRASIEDPSRRVKPGEVFTVAIPPPLSDAAAPEAIALAIVYEDDQLIVIDKPAGLVVHPAAGHRSGTLVNGLIAHCGASLSGIGGVKRPGIVHRLDKETSGLIVVAKTDVAHRSLSEQFKSHGRDGRLHRAYLALVWGVPVRPKGTIDAALARSPANRTKIAVTRREGGRHARTHYEVLATYGAGQTASLISLVKLTLETGRTHQIRVHLAHIGHPVLADPVYGTAFKTREKVLPDRVQDALSKLNRQALHATELGFEHPQTAELMQFESELPPEIKGIIEALAKPLEQQGKRAAAPGNRKRPRLPKSR